MDLQALIDEKDDEILSDVEELETPLPVMDLGTGQRESPSDENDRQADQVDSTTSQKKEFYGRVSAQVRSSFSADPEVCSGGAYDSISFHHCGSRIYSAMFILTHLLHLPIDTLGYT